MDSDYVSSRLTLIRVVVLIWFVRSMQLPILCGLPHTSCIPYCVAYLISQWFDVQQQLAGPRWFLYHHDVHFVSVAFGEVHNFISVSRYSKTGTCEVKVLIGRERERENLNVKL